MNLSEQSMHGSLTLCQIRRLQLHQQAPPAKNNFSMSKLLLTWRLPLRQSSHHTSRLGRYRPLVVPVMLGLLTLYGALHSPLRELLRFVHGRTTGECLLCAEALLWSAALTPLSAWLCLSLAFVATVTVSSQFRGAPYERWLIGGLSGLAWIVVPAATVGEFADIADLALLRPPLGPLIAAVPAGVYIVLQLRRGWRPVWPQFHLGAQSSLVRIVGALAATGLLTSVAISLMHPPTGGDALSYHAVLAAYLWRDGTLGSFLDRAPEIWALAHPGTAELWFGLLGLAAGERLADLGQLPFALLGAAASCAFARRLGLGQGSGLLAAGAFLLAPMVVLQAGMQPNDIVGAALLMTTMALAGAPAQDWTHERLSWIGLGLGLIAVTKLALLPSAAAVGLFVAGALFGRSARRCSLRTVALQLLLVTLVACIAVAPWWTRNVARFGNPIYPAALPLLGRGVNVHDLGPIDIAFVPGPATWPLYPLLEPHDDRSGFGALLLVGALPGCVLALWRGHRQPLILYFVVTVITLPAWWVLTLHEPRFLLALAGLGFAFLPWSLLTVPRHQRRIGALVIAATALFSLLVTFDQALLPFGQQPNVREAFYDRVWAVDPFVLSMPEQQGILYQTGYAPTIFEYTAYYPLLGPTLSRTVFPLDWVPSTESIIARMQQAGVRYAYITASPENRSTVESLYDRSHFELVHQSTVVVGESSGARRHLYRVATEAEESLGTRRYLFRLK